MVQNYGVQEWIIQELLETPCLKMVDPITDPIDIPINFELCYLHCINI